MELEDSLSCSQEPSTGPYSEPVQSSPYHYILYLRQIFKLSTNIILELVLGY
jgi:hypothetical protein